MSTDLPLFPLPVETPEGHWADGETMRIDDDRRWTWAELVQVEPKLLAAERWVRSFSQFDERLWPSIKQRIMPLVGWGARDRRLTSCHAFNAAADHLRAIFEELG